MADDTPPNTPETLADEVQNATEQAGTPEPTVVETDTLADEVHNAQQQGGVPTPGAPGVPQSERRAARRSERDRAAGRRGPKTPEERDAERRARRERNARQRRAYRAKLKAKRAEAGEAGPAQTPPAAEHGPGRPKVRQGVVVSDKADKTIVVRVDEARRHRRYRKILRTSVKFHAHDEANDANVGDTVRIVEARPLSRTKRWRLVDVLERAR
jgi:small subunit ribosomal protein S17